MINLSFNIATGLARFSSTAAIKMGADVPVRLTFSSAPGDVDALQLALGSDAIPSAILAFTEDFAQENATTWTALLDATDTRLATFMSGKGPTGVNLELVCVIDGARQVAPSLAITVQPQIITGPASSMGGPSYYTAAQVDAAIAAALAGMAGAATATRSGEYSIPAGQAFAHITFAPAFSSDAWHFSELVVIDTTDTSAVENIFIGTITSRDATGFTVQLSGATDSAYYKLKFLCTLSA